MGFSSQTKTNPDRVFLVMLAAVTYFAILAGIGLWRLDGAAAEAVTLEEICRELLLNSTVGRQALVSSVWQAPLPVLLRLPLVAMMDFSPCPVASVLISAAFGTAVILLLAHLFRGWRLGRLRWLLLLAVAGNPEYLAQCVNGSSATTILFFILVSVYGLLEWFRQRQVRHLVYLAFSGAVLAGMSFAVFSWQLLLFLLLLAELRFKVTGRAQKEAVIILAVLPAVYLAGVWILMNWLIMGAPGYFLHSLAIAGGDRWLSHDGAVGFTLQEGWAAALGVLGVLLFARQRDFSGVVLGILGMAPILLGEILILRGWMWSRTPFLSSAFPLAVAVTGYMVVKLERLPGKVRVLLCLLPVAISLEQILTWNSGAGPADTLSTVTAERQQWLPLIERHVRQISGYPKVFVCGYDGFRLAGGQAGGVFEIALDLNFFKVRHDYRGHTLFLLVHRPSGRSAMDSIHWQYDRIYYLGGSGTLYDGDWGEWRLFEIIEAPE